MDFGWNERNLGSDENPSDSALPGKRVFHHQSAEAAADLTVFADQYVGASAQRGFQDQRIPPLQLVLLRQRDGGLHALRGAAHDLKGAQSLHLRGGFGRGQGRLQLARGDGVELLQHLGAENHGAFTGGACQAVQRAFTPRGVAGIDGVHQHMGVEEADHASPPLWLG